MTPSKNNSNTSKDNKHVTTPSKTQNQIPGKNTPNTSAPGKGSAPTAVAKPSAEAPKTDGAKADKDGDGKGKRAKRERIRLVSPSNSKLWCRMFKDVYDAHGGPVDPAERGGKPWEVKKGTAFGMSAEDRSKKAEAKKAEEERIKNMSPEEKTAFLRQKRDEKNAKKEAKLQTERSAIEDKLRVGMYLDLLGKGIDIGPLVDALDAEGKSPNAVKELRAKMAETAEKAEKAEAVKQATAAAQVAQ